MKEISFHDILVGATLVGTFLLSYCNKHSFWIVCKPQRKEIFKGSFTTESYQQMKDGWTVANPQILSYHFITKQCPKSFHWQIVYTSNTKGQNGTLSMEQIATGGEILCEGCWESVLFGFNLKITGE